MLLSVACCVNIVSSAHNTLRHWSTVSWAYFLQNATQSLKFFLLSIGFLAGRYDLRFFSTNLRLILLALFWISPPATTAANWWRWMDWSLLLLQLRCPFCYLYSSSLRAVFWTKMNLFLDIGWLYSNSNVEHRWNFDNLGSNCVESFLFLIIYK